MSRAALGELLLRWLPLVIFAAVLLYFGLQAPRFLGPDSLANIVKQASFTGIIAVGMTAVIDFFRRSGGQRPGSRRSLRRS